MANEPYIDQAFYDTEYEGRAIPEAEFSRISKRASTALDHLTLHRVRRAGLSTFSTEHQDSIKLATSALAEGIKLEDDATDGTGVLKTRESIGGTFSSEVDPLSIDSIRAAARGAALNYLLYTGLAYAGGMGL